MDDSQKIRGFTKGLNPEIKKHVLSKDPQTLEEAIKQARVYDDPSKGDDETKALQQNTRPSNSNGNKVNNQKKRKFNNDTNNQGKKPKSTSWPLSKEDFERAKKDNCQDMSPGMPRQEPSRFKRLET